MINNLKINILRIGDTFRKLGMIVESTIDLKCSPEEFKDSLDRITDNRNHVPRIHATDNNYRGIIKGNFFSIETNVKPNLDDQIDAQISGHIESTSSGIKIQITSDGIRSGSLVVLIVGIGFVFTGLLALPFTLSLEPLAMIPVGAVALIICYYKSQNAASSMLIKFQKDITRQLNRHVRNREK